MWNCKGSEKEKRKGRIRVKENLLMKVYVRTCTEKIYTCSSLQCISFRNSSTHVSNMMSCSYSTKLYTWSAYFYIEGGYLSIAVYIPIHFSDSCSHTWAAKSLTCASLLTLASANLDSAVRRAANHCENVGDSTLPMKWAQTYTVLIRSTIPAMECDAVKSEQERVQQ